MTLDTQLKKFWRFGVLDLDPGVGKYLTWGTWDQVPESYRKDFQILIDSARTDCCSASKWINGKNYSLHRTGSVKEAMGLQPRTRNGEMILYIFRDVWRGVHPSSMLGRWDEPSETRPTQPTPVVKAKPKAKRKKKEDTVQVAGMISDFADLL